METTFWHETCSFHRRGKADSSAILRDGDKSRIFLAREEPISSYPEPRRGLSELVLLFPPSLYPNSSDIEFVPDFPRNVTPIYPHSNPLIRPKKRKNRANKLGISSSFTRPRFRREEPPFFISFDGNDRSRHDFLRNSDSKMKNLCFIGYLYGSR